MSTITQSRRSDPATSRAAAEQHEAKAASHREVLLAAVRKHPGKTAAELAAITGLDYHESARRLPELRKSGHIVRGEARTCSIRGNECQTWIAAERRDKPQPVAAVTQAKLF